MLKDITRDYATAAFQYYAMLGKPSHKSLKAQYMAEALEQYQKVKTDCKGAEVSKPTEAAVMYAEKEVERKEAELRDVLAVEKTLTLLHDEEKKAVELVYFSKPKGNFKKGEISNLVQYVSEELYCDARTVYRYLSKARKVFCLERGLRN